MIITSIKRWNIRELFTQLLDKFSFFYNQYFFYQFLHRLMWYYFCFIVIFVYFGLFIFFVKEIYLFSLISNEFFIAQSFYFSLNESVLKTEYLGILIYFIIALVLSLVFVTLSYFLSIQNPDLEKLSTYECGFEPYEDARHSFEIKFCVIAILFIVFDIEIMFLFPWCLTLSQLNLLGFWSMIDFVLELGVAFIYVWSRQALEWD